VNRTPLLSVEHVTKHFGGLVAVNDVNLHIHKHEIVGLIGTNGAGKTTLFNMIAGDLKPSSGKIKYKDHEIHTLPSFKICKSGIARTYQIVKPFADLTVLENVMVGAFLKLPKTETAKRKALEVLDFVGLMHLRDVPGRDLNLPQLKRLELARAMATQPELLLLDEVMAGLNPTESAKMIELVRSIRERGITLLVIEHVMKAIMSLSDRVYVMNQGLLIAEGTPEETVNNPAVIKSYLGENKYAQSK
jgi:branched-chain amino acid transport system ATP-binding protein